MPVCPTDFFYDKVRRMAPLHARSKSCGRIIIIGAGPCGLGAAWRLNELGVEHFTVYEQQDHPGGLASSYTDANGFTWDVGGHVLHSHYPYFDRVFEDVMCGEYLTHERESWIWIYDRFVPYPLQNNIHRLPAAVRDACLIGLQKALRQKKPDVHTFADWIRASFGEGIAKHFLFPYNEKVWAYPPEKMNYLWVGDRVAQVDIGRIKENIRLNRDDVSWGPNATFKFPKQGGTGDIWLRIAQRVKKHIRYSHTVTRIDVRAKTIHFADGSSDTYDTLFSTMPLDTLCTRIHDMTDMPTHPPLVFSHVHIVGFGIRGETPAHLKTKCWMYFPEHSAPFFRATVFSNYSPNNAPEGTWSLMTETASSSFRPLPDTDFVEKVLRGAKNTKLLSGNASIVSVWRFDTDHGYPTPTLDRDSILSHIQPKLESHGIFSRGRFGAWKYEISNQDHVFMQGVEWADRIVNHGNEPTLYH